MSWKNKSWKIVLIGSILLTLVLVGVVYAVRALPSQAAQPTPALGDLLLSTNDVCDCAAGCEEVERITTEGDKETLAKEVAEFTGLPLDYQEGAGVYLIAYVKRPKPPKSVGQALYRYESREQAAAHYEQLLKALPDAPLGRETPIISTSEWSFKGVRGQVIEAQDPWGKAYWFIGTRGNLLTGVGVLSQESMGQPLFKQLVPLAVERMAGSQ